MRNTIPNPHDPNFGRSPARQIPEAGNNKPENQQEGASKSVLSGYRPISHENINPNIQRMQEDQFLGVRDNNGGIVSHGFKTPAQKPEYRNHQFARHPEATILPPAPAGLHHVDSEPISPLPHPLSLDHSQSPIPQNLPIAPVPASESPVTSGQESSYNPSHGGFITGIIEGTSYSHETSAADITEAAPTILSGFKDRKLTEPVRGIRRAKGYAPKSSSLVKFIIVVFVVGMSVFLYFSIRTVVSDTTDIIENIKTQTEAKQKAREARKKASFNEEKYR